MNLEQQNAALEKRDFPSSSRDRSFLVPVQFGLNGLLWRTVLSGQFLQSDDCFTEVRDDAHALGLA